MLDVVIFLLAWSPPEVDYPQTITQLDAALATVGAEDTSMTESVQALEQALALAAQFPHEVPSDGATLDKLGRARLALAWLYLVDANDEAANAAMDEALRSARGTSLPSGSFGPKVRALHDERQRALKQQGTAVIEVDCGAVACQVVIDERRSANPSDPLYLGSYRVWIGARDGSAWEFYTVELGEAGGVSKLAYAAGAVATTEGPEPPPEPLFDGPVAKPKRLMPVWAEAIGITVGVGLIVAGAILLAFDGECNDSEVESLAQATCYQNKPQAYSLLGIGAGTLLSFGVVLSVDEARRVRGTKTNRAMLTWTLRF